MNLEEFKRDRDAALRSNDRATLEAYFTKYGVPIPKDEVVFWGAVHKAITGLKTLPLELRKASKAC